MVVPGKRVRRESLQLGLPRLVGPAPVLAAGPVAIRYRRKKFQLPVQCTAGQMPGTATGRQQQ